MAKNWIDFKTIKSKVSMQMVLEHYGLLEGFKEVGGVAGRLLPYSSRLKPSSILGQPGKELSVAHRAPNDCPS